MSQKGKFIYTKLLISILCFVSILSAFSVGFDGLKQWDDYKTEIYSFEEDFEDSSFLNYTLMNATYNVYDIVASSFEDPNIELVEALNNILDKNQMIYNLKIDGKEYKNGDTNTQKFFYQINISKDGVIQENKYPEEYGDIYVSTSRVEGHDIKLYVGLKDDFVETCAKLWNEQKELVETTIKNVVLWLLGAIFFLILLMIQTGNEQESFIDRIYIEVKLVNILLVLILGIELAVVLLDEYFYLGLSSNLLKLFVEIIMLAVYLIALPLGLSMVRNIKQQMFLKRSLIARMIVFAFRLIKKIYSQLGQLVLNHMAVAVISILFFYTAFIGWFGYLGFRSMGWVLFGVILFIVLGYFVLVYMNDLQKIKNGISHMNVGDINYKIEEVTYKDLRTLKDQINHISDGLQSAVERTLKAERLKTELITNVSHDLKTPLTSIISYTKLLAGVEGLPEEAKDYITIIDKKSQRLKTLTQDLFAISKVQSGNEHIVLEKLNVGTLLSQSLAEFEKELSPLTICSRVEDQLYILSDGRKMSRILNNLIENIIKYTMPQTRVFIDAYQKDDEVVIEMKNISNYPLDFDTDEIMQRFKRGDEARSEEGHGLGLAIVKSYVEATGGSFNITLDGDLFKAMIRYKKV